MVRKGFVLSPLLVTASIAICILGLSGCESNSIDTVPGDSNALYLRYFYVKWGNGDTLDFAGKIGENGGWGGPIIHQRNALVYQGETADGPWRLIFSHPGSNAPAADSFRVSLDIPNTGQMLYFRLDAWYEGEEGLEYIEGPIIITRRPESHPSSWASGPILEANIPEEINEQRGTVLSDDGKKLFAQHRDGRLFDMETGEYIRLSSLLMERHIISGTGRWADTLIYLYGNRFSIVDSRTLETITSMSTEYSYPDSDSTFAVKEEGSKNLFRYNTVSQSFHLIDTSRENAAEISNASISPSGAYLACASTLLATPRSPNGFRLFDADLQPDRSLYPLGSYNHILYDLISDVFPIYQYSDDALFTVQWNNNSEWAYFWANWSGAYEIWAYHIPTGEYHLLTGYRDSDYPARYAPVLESWNGDEPRVSSLNFAYDKSRDNIVMFFTLDAYRYAVRYIELPE